jgi:hypothetical protein
MHSRKLLKRANNPQKMPQKAGFVMLFASKWRARRGNV